MPANWQKHKFKLNVRLLPSVSANAFYETDLPSGAR